MDTETAAIDPLTDEVIERSVVMLKMDDAGVIIGIASAGQVLRDPHADSRVEKCP